MKTDFASGAFVVDAVDQCLAEVAFHSNFGGVARSLFLSRQLDARSPMHVAVHHFDGTARCNEGEFPYSELHFHRDFEVDIVIPISDDFEFEVQTGDQCFIISRCSTIVIPAGVIHRMCVLKGKGLMVCTVFGPEYKASSYGDD